MNRRAAPTGYTLIELLIVLSIIAVLAAGSLALLAGRSDDARFREAARELLAACEIARQHGEHRREVVALRIGDDGASYALVRVESDGRATALRGLAGRPRRFAGGARLTLTPMETAQARLTSMAREPRWGPTAAVDVGWALRLRDDRREATVVLRPRSRLAALSGPAVQPSAEGAAP